VAWSLAAIYHATQGNDFKVPPGSLGFSVLVFCILAILAIAALMFRRFSPSIGAELGGPKGSRILSTLFFTLLWIIYVLLASLESYCHIKTYF